MLGLFFFVIKDDVSQYVKSSHQFVILNKEVGEQPLPALELKFLGIRELCSD